MDVGGGVNDRLGGVGPSLANRPYVAARLRICVNGTDQRVALEVADLACQRRLQGIEGLLSPMFGFVPRDLDGVPQVARLLIGTPRPHQDAIRAEQARASVEDVEQRRGQRLGRAHEGHQAARRQRCCTVVQAKGQSQLLGLHLPDEHRPVDLERAKQQLSFGASGDAWQQDVAVAALKVGQQGLGSNPGNAGAPEPSPSPTFGTHLQAQLAVSGERGANRLIGRGGMAHHIGQGRFDQAQGGEVGFEDSGIEVGLRHARPAGRTPAHSLGRHRRVRQVVVSRTIIMAMRKTIHTA